MSKGTGPSGQHSKSGDTWFYPPNLSTKPRISCVFEPDAALYRTGGRITKKAHFIVLSSLAASGQGEKQIRDGAKGKCQAEFELENLSGLGG